MMAKLEPTACPQKIAELGHDLRGALNVIGLAAANVQARASAGMPDEQQVYLSAKMERIEQQVERSRRLLNALEALAQTCPLQGAAYAD